MLARFLNIFITLLLFTSCAKYGLVSSRTPSSIEDEFSCIDGLVQLSSAKVEAEHIKKLKEVFKTKSLKSKPDNTIIEQYYNQNDDRFKDHILGLRHAFSGSRLRRLNEKRFKIPLHIYGKEIELDVFHRFENREPFSYSATMLISVINIVFKDTKSAKLEESFFKLINNRGIKTVDIKYIQSIKNESLVVKEYIQGATRRDIQDLISSNQIPKGQGLNLLRAHDNITSELKTLIKMNSEFENLKLENTSLLYWNGDWYLDWVSS